MIGLFVQNKSEIMYQTPCFNLVQTDPGVESLGVQRQQMQRKPGYAIRPLENIQNI